MVNIDDKKIPKGTTETPIVGRLHDVSEDHVVTGANEVFDDAFGERQSKVNRKLKHFTKLAHSRIDAEEITRDYEDTQLRNELNAKQLEIGAVQTDSEPIPESPNMLPSGAIAFNIGCYYGNDNPEWLYLLTDGANRIIGGVKRNGNIEWAAGVPSPVKKYIAQKIKELKDYTDIELFKKVGKEEGKSLIDEQYANSISVEFSPEFIDVKLDALGRIIEANKRNGTKLFGAGIDARDAKFNAIRTKSAEITTIQDPEFLCIVLTKDNKILYGVKKNTGDFYFGCGVPSQIVKYVEERISSFSDIYGKIIESPEFGDLILDKNNKIVVGVRHNGTPVFSGKIKTTIENIAKSVQEETPMDNQEETLLTNGKLYYDNSFCTIKDCSIRYSDGKISVTGTQDCTEKIPISIAKYLMYVDIWPYGSDAWTALAIYNSNDEVIYRGSDYGIVNLEELEDASYFRFVSDRAEFFKLPRIVLSINNDFVETADEYSAKYINVRQDYKNNGNSRSQHTGWGFNSASLSDINVSMIEVGYNNVADSNIGDVIDVFVGSVDQRNLFLLRKTSKARLVRQDKYAGVNYYTPTDSLIIQKGEICIVNCGYYVNFRVLSSVPSYGQMVNYDGEDADNFEIRNDNVCLTHFVISGTFADGVNESDYDYDTISEYIDTKVELSKILTDTATGRRYELYVENGILKLNDISIDKILIIGNSFTSHENAEGVWWGDYRGMAASVDTTQYKYYVEHYTGAELDVVRGFPFETNYSPTYDFNTNIPITEDYDCVIIQIGENGSYNSTMEASWKALYDYVLSKVPEATVIQVIGGANDQKVEAINRAAASRNIPVLDCRKLTKVGQISLGCYVTSSVGDYHAVTHSGVSGGHPSDVGMYLIANTILAKIKYELPNQLRKITISDNANHVWIPYDSWPVTGVVNVKCDDSVTGITVETEDGDTVSAVRRTNAYGTFYTFVMPDDNVVITPSIN